MFLSYTLTEITKHFAKNSSGVLNGAPPSTLKLSLAKCFVNFLMCMNGY